MVNIPVFITANVLLLELANKKAYLKANISAKSNNYMNFLSSKPSIELNIVQFYDSIYNECLHIPVHFTVNIYSFGYSAYFDNVIVEEL